MEIWFVPLNGNFLWMNRYVTQNRGYVRCKKEKLFYLACFSIWNLRISVNNFKVYAGDKNLSQIVGTYGWRVMLWSYHFWYFVCREWHAKDGICTCIRCQTWEQTKCVCETQMSPIVSDSKGGQGHKDEYLDSSRKILSQEMGMCIYESS